MMNEPRAEYDSPWKEALEHYFAEFIAFFFPQAHTDIEWEKGHEFLDEVLLEVGGETYARHWIERLRRHGFLSPS